MIRLNITAGYAWSVWDDKGGLQPTIESLAIPPKFSTKLKAWSERSVPSLHAPTFTGRKDFDAEGRALAVELQRAAGDKFHVIFRHWAAFDAQQWRSRWREENLVSGTFHEFWLDEDLPENVVLKVVRIFPDCAGAYLWDLDGCCIGNGTLAFPDDLDDRFRTWSERWDALRDFRTMKQDKAQLAAEGFDEKGLTLAVELKRAVGEVAKVIYYCNLREATLEVFEDGKIVDWPREADFRQWALDQIQC